MVSVAGGTGVYYSFQNATIEVMTSFILFVIGYRTCQITLDSQRKIKDILKHNPITPTNKEETKLTALFLTGSLLFSQGFVQLAKTIQQFSIKSGILAGTLILGGYIPAHMAVNKRII
jgi:hypothetical protein